MNMLWSTLWVWCGVWWIYTLLVLARWLLVDRPRCRSVTDCTALFCVICGAMLFAPLWSPFALLLAAEHHP